VKEYTTKLKHILPTFIIITFGTVFVLAILRWLLCLEYSIIDIREEIWTIWIPIIFPWIPILIFIRPRFRILTFQKDNDNGRTFFQFLTWGTMVVMLLVSQSYLTTSTGRIEQLGDVKLINESDIARYYKLERFTVEKKYSGAYFDVRTSGRYNEHMDFTVYFAFPILSYPNEIISEIPKYWYGIKYTEQISNRSSEDEKEKEYDAFYAQCIQQVSNYSFQTLDHFERLPTSKDRKNYLKAIENRIDKETDDSFVVLVPVQETYESRNGNKFAWIFGSFGIGLTVMLFSLIFPGYSETERKRFIKGKKPKHDDLMEIVKFLVPRSEHFATSLIIDLNIVIFILMVLSGVNIISANGSELLQWGANRRAEILNGEWWRLLTSMFLHGSIMHLFLNICGLVISAMFIEPIFGRIKFLILYLLSGLGGSVASILWNTGSISVGASGAIFGIYGAILGLLLTNAYPNDSKKGILSFIGIYVLINLVWGLTGGIDNAAHIGGLICGAIFGVILFKISGNDVEQKNRKPIRVRKKKSANYDETLKNQET
jgi:rhomboid protease GluP